MDRAKMYSKTKAARTAPSSLTLLMVAPAFIACAQPLAAETSLGQPPLQCRVSQNEQLPTVEPLARPPWQQPPYQPPPYVLQPPPGAQPPSYAQPYWPAPPPHAAAFGLGASQHFVPPQFFDPDETPEMRLAWEAWHKRVATSIYQRWHFFARIAFRNSRPLRVRVAYYVTSTGHLRDLSMLEESPNPFFNMLVNQVLRSLDGDLALLQLPLGSRRTAVRKTGDFVQNVGGNGFTYTTGDYEHVR